MKDFIIGLLLFIAMMFGIAWLEEQYLSSNPKRYHYVDVVGEEGDAPDCSSSRGAMTCELEDHRKIMVKEYWRND